MIFWYSHHLIYSVCLCGSLITKTNWNEQMPGSAPKFPFADDIKGSTTESTPPVQTRKYRHFCFLNVAYLCSYRQKWARGELKITIPSPSRTLRFLTCVDNKALHPIVIARHWLFSLILCLLGSLPLTESISSLLDLLSGTPDIHLTVFFSYSE